MVLFRGWLTISTCRSGSPSISFPPKPRTLPKILFVSARGSALAEMIRGGTTAYCDMYYFEDAIADETFKAGMRGCSARR